MSTKRSPYDFYPTPKEVIDKILDNYGFNPNATFCEPCAGNGILVKALREKFPNATIIAHELDESHKEELDGCGANMVAYTDFLKCENNGEKVDYIITNPPFSLAQEFIEHSFTWANNVIMLLRLNFLGSQKRHDFWQKYPPTKIYVLSKRPSFTGNGTDSQEYAWFVWDNRKWQQPISVL